MESKKEKKGVNKTALILGSVFIVAGLVFARSLIVDNGKPAAGPGPMAEAGATILSVKTAAAETRTLRAFLDVNGDIVSSQQIEVYPDAAGKISRVTVALGTQVKKGDIIAEVDPSRPGTTYMGSPVYAPISGIVSRTPLAVGTTVSQSSSVTTISLIENLEISARIPEREIAGLHTGLKADVTLQAYPGVVFTATITRVSPVLDSASRTKLVTLRFDQSDSRINAGMFARVSLNTRTYENVITVPAEAVITRYGEKYVYTLSESGGGQGLVEMRPVNAGVTLNGLTEITSGLDTGTQVVVQGQQLLSGGETVRLITDADTRPANKDRLAMASSAAAAGADKEVLQ
jgi:multidrug efflux pump subunit AcrA (membrane-fusion protein)